LGFYRFGKIDFIFYTPRRHEEHEGKIRDFVFFVPSW